MSVNFEELDYQETELGPVSLRRRRILSLGGVDVLEIQLGDAFLMSSLFTKVEVELARIPLETFGEGECDVVVGGLGLGYTAHAALKTGRVKSLVVIEALAPVIDWHRRGLVPTGPQLIDDPRCQIVHGDFFRLARSNALDGRNHGRRFHAVLLDIDHSPGNVLHPRHREFYSTAGLRRLASHLHPAGVFAMWSDEPPEDEFLSALDEVFPKCDAHVVSFHNPLLEREASSTVYVARTADTQTRP